MKLTIDRKIWLRGEGCDNSFLLRLGDGKRCCVGIYLSALGFPDEQLAGAASAVTAAGMRTSRLAIPGAPGWLWRTDGERLEHSSDAISLYTDNDDPEAGERRERSIAEIFARHGVEVEFVG